jgi:hypothetical protein
MFKAGRVCLLHLTLLTMVACSTKSEETGVGFSEFPWTPPPKPSAFAVLPAKFLMKSHGKTYVRRGKIWINKENQNQ